MRRCILILTLSLFETTLAAQSLAKRQSIRIGNEAEPRELDPALATGVVEGHLIDALFEGLTNSNPFQEEPSPGVAESWTISPDGKTYIFTLRKNAKWSDGKALTAEDFVYSWIRVLDPKTASEYAYQLYYIKNGEAFNKGTLKDPKQLGVKAKNPHTLEVQLERPTPFFLQLTDFQTLYPTPRHVIEKYPGSTWTRENNMVSNGPYKLSEARLHQHIKITKNETYWDKDSVKMNEIYLDPIENKNTEEATFTAGKLHLTSTVPALRIPYYESLPKNNPKVYNPYREEAIYGVYYYRFNTTRKPLNDARVRRALSLSIDRKQIVENVARGGKIPAGNFTPPYGIYKFPSELPLTTTEASLKEARRLLKEAGYENGNNMPKFDILYETDENNKRIALAIQEMWHKNLGVKVGLFNQEWKVYLESLRTLGFDIARSRWIADYQDPNTFLDLFLTNGGNNNTGWSNKKYDETIRAAATSANTKDRFDKFKVAEDLLMKELPIMPIFFYTNTHLVAKTLKLRNPQTGRISDWKSDVMGRLHLKYCVLIEP